jgi:GNAT superfamily N-acetyltransferase
MENKQSAASYLAKDPLLHIAISESIARNNAQTLYAGNDGMIIINISSGDYHLSIDNQQTLLTMLPRIESCGGLILYQPHWQNILMQSGFRQIAPSAYISAFLESDITIPYIKGLTFQALSEEYLPIIQAKYRLIANESYLRQRLRQGMTGVFYHQQLAGFAGIHDDGSLGMLEIFPPFQRRGFGSALTCYLVEQELKKGHIPYGYCFTSNTASLQLQQKLGFLISRTPVMMLHRQSDQ